MSVHSFQFNTTAKLPLVGKEYMCFKIDGKYDQAAKCVKSRIFNKMIDFVLSIDIFEQKSVIIKGVLQSLRLKDHINTIGIDQSLSNSALF